MAVPRPGATAREGLPVPGSRVVVVVGEGRVESAALGDGARVIVGRDPACTIVLDHPSVSRHHAAVHGGPPLELEDLGSTNGIRLDGRRLGTGARHGLALGASVQVGPFVVAVLGERCAAISEGPRFTTITISDPTPEGVPEVALRVARAGVSALLVGETGTGKEVLACTLHQLSGRAGRFVAVNCAALSEPLLESELFGHERGAFTGAAAAKPGLFEVARGGTVFLDEIGELPAPLQAKLLRVLETREAYRLGAVVPTRLDVRFVAATHRDLAAEVQAGRFRQDFYFRINGIALTLAPLRARREAIPELARRLLAAAAGPRPAPVLDDAALAILIRHDWPGNVRELRTVIERAVMLSDGGAIGPGDILLDQLASGASDGKARLEAAAAVHRGSVSAIARVFGTSRSQIRRLAARHGIALARYR